MKRKRFTEEQIIAVLQQAEAGVKTGELCRQAGISQQTFYRWKSKYGGMKVRFHRISLAQAPRYLRVGN